MARRQCPNCGTFVPEVVNQCPNCRELLLEVPRVVDRGPAQGMAQIRRGLLYMLLASVLYYFAAGHSSFAIPVAVPNALHRYLLPLLFVSGLGLTAYGIFRRLTA